MNKAITLLGMSGAGKTHFSQRLAAWGWVHYSNDFEIAGSLGINVEIDDLSALSAFVGQVGDETKGGLNLAEFIHRQKLYYGAECSVLENMPIESAQKGSGKFVNDSTGSFCEIEDEGLIARVAEKTLLVYIETDEATQAEVIARAVEYPKPLYFPTAKLNDWLDEYCAARRVDVDKIEPNDFSAWVFPKLFESRLPKYERLAEQYGVKVSAADLHGCQSEAAFLELIEA